MARSGIFYKVLKRLRPMMEGAAGTVGSTRTPAITLCVNGDASVPQCGRTGLGTHRDGLLLDAAHWQDLAGEGDLACHGQVVPHRPVHGQREQGCDDGAAGARAVLGGGALEGRGRWVAGRPDWQVVPELPEPRRASPRARAGEGATPPGTGCWGRAASGRPWRRCRRCGRSPSSRPPAGLSPPGSRPCPHGCPSLVAVLEMSRRTAWSLLEASAQRP